MNLKNLIRLLKTSPWLVPVLAGIDLVLLLTDTLARLTTPAKRQPNTILIIKLDVLGDYLLFRNYLRVIRQSARYQNHRLVFCGNVAAKSIAEIFDSDIIEQFLWTDIYKLSTRPLYRFRFVQRLRQIGAEVVFCPTYSRVLVLDDFLAVASGARERIGCHTDFINMNRWEAWFGNRLYTRLISTKPGILFEMERNRQLVEGFLQEPVAAQPPILNPYNAKSVELPTRFIVFSLGAGQDFRIWPARRFAEVADILLAGLPNHQIVLTGAPSEKQYANDFLRYLVGLNRIMDLTGKLSLPELVFVLTRADALLTNETGIVHIAASTQTPTIVISQGKSLVRWHPYPTQFGGHIHHIYPDFIEKHRADLASIAPQFNPESSFAITDIITLRVVTQIEKQWLLSHDDNPIF